jgi:glutamyl-tRNA synthetase
MGASAKDAGVVTRFAPSPTGFLHIGGARTALFNLLFARHHGGTFKLRIEDTDRARSTQAAIDAIIDGMSWHCLDWDGDIVFQSEREARHAEVAHSLLASGGAYKCFATAEELEEMRARARAEKRPMRYDGRWRDRDPSEAQEGAPYVVRLRAPTEGETVIDDTVQGRVTVRNSELDDMVLLRSDGTPTYMLAVVVDDNDMGITHVIRGDDHLNNAFRQLALIRALGWHEPSYAHVPLIHGQDGAKLSKRHGALGVDAYRDMGFLPEAVENYLLRLGWGHGDQEFFTRGEAAQLFTLEGIGRGPARFDMKKLENVNGHYLRAADDMRLTALAAPLVEAAIARALNPTEQDLLLRTMPHLKVRARTLNELAESALFLFRTRPIQLDEKAKGLLDSDGVDRLAAARDVIAAVDEWTAPAFEAALRATAEQSGVGLGKFAQPLRAALTGSTTSPGIFEVLEVLGRDESLGRMDDQLNNVAASAAK